MSRFGDDLIQAMGEALAHARGEGPVGAADLTEIAHVAEALLHDAYLAACEQEGRALDPADLALPSWAEVMLAEAFEQLDANGDHD